MASSTKKSRTSASMETPASAPATPAAKKMEKMPPSAKSTKLGAVEPSPSSSKKKKYVKGDGVLKLVRFTVDCTLAALGHHMDIEDFQKFLRERVESTMDKTANNVGNFVVVKSKESKVTVTSGPPFTKKVLKSLTKKYLKKNNLASQFTITAKGLHSYQLTKKKNSNDDEENVEDNED